MQLRFCDLRTTKTHWLAVKVDQQPKVKVEYDRLELLEFLRANFGPLNAMCERGGMFERLIYERTKAIFGYFSLPFDQPSAS